MPKPIVARWEWRTFGTGFDTPEKNIRVYKEGNFKESEEIYILSSKSDENTKVRDDLMDIKALQNVNGNKLEQWMPVMKQGFPIGTEALKELFAIFKLPAPSFARGEYTFAQFLDEVIRPNKDLRIVKVHKKRHIYVINDCVVEIAETLFDGKPLKTICVEHEDPENVYKTVCELGLKDYPNVNYIQAMKKSTGMI